MRHDTMTFTHVSTFSLISEYGFYKVYLCPANASDAPLDTSGKKKVLCLPSSEGRGRSRFAGRGNKQIFCNCVAN